MGFGAVRGADDGLDTSPILVDVVAAQKVILRVISIVLYGPAISSMDPLHYPPQKVVLMRGHNLHLALVRHLRQNVLVQLRVSCAREAFLAIGTEA